MKTLEAKVVLLGDQGVGKTSLIVQYINKSFPNKVMSTIGASFFNSKICIEDYRVNLQIWDTAGHERFKAMAPMFYRNANAAVVVFDITIKSTLEEVQYWVNELTKNIDDSVVICIVGNKIDLGSQRQISFETAQKFAHSIGAFYIETSAYTNEGVNELFFQLALDLIKVSQAKAIRKMQQADLPHGYTTTNQRKNIKISEEEMDERRPLLCC